MSTVRKCLFEDHNSCAVAGTMSAASSTRSSSGGPGLRLRKSSRRNDDEGTPKAKKASSSKKKAKIDSPASAVKQVCVNEMFSVMDPVEPTHEIGRQLELPGTMFSGGRILSKVCRMVEIVEYHPARKLKNSVEPAFQFRDLKDEYDPESLWITLPQYQKCRHEYWLRFPEKKTGYTAVVTELARIENIELTMGGNQTDDGDFVSEKEGSGSGEDLEDDMGADEFDGVDLVGGEDDTTFVKDRFMRSKIYNHFEPHSQTLVGKRVSRKWRHTKSGRLVTQVKVSNNKMLIMKLLCLYLFCVSRALQETLQGS